MPIVHQDLSLATVHQHLTYEYDSIGNVKVITDGRWQKFSNGINTNETQSFDYDPLDRLIQANGFYARPRHR
jgi:hypothetical protein